MDNQSHDVIMWMHWMSIVSNGEVGLDKVPEKYRSPAIYRAAVARRGTQLGEVPEDIIDEDMCVEAIKHIHFNPRDIPKKFRNERIQKLLLERLLYGTNWM